MLALKKLYYEKYAKKSYSLSNIDVVIDYIFKGIKKGIYMGSFKKQGDPNFFVM